MIRETYTAKVHDLKKINSYMYDLWLTTDKVFQFKSGQFVSIYMNDTETRSYSIASSPIEAINNNRVRIILGPKPDGISKKFLDKLDIGSEVKFRGPYGIFTFDRIIPDLTNFNKKIIFLSTGTGITSLLSHAEYLKDILYKGEVYFYFGIRNYPDYVFQKDFEGISKYINLKYKIAISKPQSLDKESDIIKFGHITDYITDEINQDDYFFICGSTSAVSSIADMLRIKGFKNIFFENYG